jgi:hypothetical protein
METDDLKPRKDLLLNPMQLILEMAPQRIRAVQCGRGGGKSTGAAIDIKNTLYDMPLSKNFTLSETYQAALTRTLPSTVKALGFLGFKKGPALFHRPFPAAKVEVAAVLRTAAGSIAFNFLLQWRGV